MLEILKSKKLLLADIIIGIGVLSLACILKDAPIDQKSQGFLVMLAAVILRVGGCRVSKNTCKTTTANAETTRN